MIGPPVGPVRAGDGAGQVGPSPITFTITSPDRPVVSDTVSVPPVADVARLTPSVPLPPGYSRTAMPGTENEQESTLGQARANVACTVFGPPAMVPVATKMPSCCSPPSNSWLRT